MREMERALAPQLGRARSVAHQHEPSWRRPTEGEHRLPVAAAVAVAIALQVLLPNHLVIQPAWPFPALEGALIVVLIVANPRRITRTSTMLRTASVALIALISLANAWSSAELIKGLINGRGRERGRAAGSRCRHLCHQHHRVFLWYWEWDRGGPVARARALRRYRDFLFPQMGQPDLTRPNWTPTYVDYLYVSFTNAAAFSPTDVMPLSRWAKMLMAVQAAGAMATIAMVVARAVNILK
jgi:hypothetical protein